MTQSERSESVDADATAWAATVESGTPVRWKQLELAAWHRHREVLNAMEPGMHIGRRLKLAFAAFFLVLVAPVVGFAFISPGVRFIAPNAGMDPVLSVRGAGLSFLVANLLLVPCSVRMLRDRSSMRGYRNLGLVPLILGLLSMALGAMKQGEVEHLWWWLSPAVLASLAGLVIVVLGGPEAKPPETPSAKQAKQDGVADRRQRRILAAAAAVPADERDGVATDLHRAVDDLARRGVIDAGKAERALQAPLGGLSHHMAQRGG